jgi:hypothetical protein
LREDGLFLRKEHCFPAIADGSEECIRIETAAIPGCST